MKSYLGLMKLLHSSFFLIALTAQSGCGHKATKSEQNSTHLSVKLHKLDNTPDSAEKKAKCAPIKVAAFDIGSGSIKALVAEQIECGEKIGQVFFESSAPTDFSKSLKDSLSISAAAENTGFKSLQELKLAAEKHRPEYWVAVATQAFRQADNGQSIIKNWSKKLNLPIHILTQDEEALLAFQAVKKFTNEQELVVWDIGGGSQQIVWQNGPSKTPRIFKSQLASVRFNEAVMELVKNDAQARVISPNPLSEEEIEVSLRLATILAEQQVPKGLKEKLSQSQIKVFGIGGVHGKSLLNQTGQKTIQTSEMLEKTLSVQKGKTDAQIGGLYAATDVTNLILTLGFMRVMGLKSYTPLRMSLAEALILSSSSR